MANLLLAIMKIVKEQQFCKTRYFKSILETFIEVYIEGTIVFVERLDGYFDKPETAEDKKNVHDQIKSIL